MIFDENMRFSCILLSKIDFLRDPGQNPGLCAVRVATGHAGRQPPAACAADAACVPNSRAHEQENAVFTSRHVHFYYVNVKSKQLPARCGHVRAAQAAQAAPRRRPGVGGGDQAPWRPPASRAQARREAEGLLIVVRMTP